MTSTYAIAFYELSVYSFSSSHSQFIAKKIKYIKSHSQHQSILIKRLRFSFSYTMYSDNINYLHYGFIQIEEIKPGSFFDNEEDSAYCRSPTPEQDTDNILLEKSMTPEGLENLVNKVTDTLSNDIANELTDLSESDREKSTSRSVSESSANKSRSPSYAHDEPTVSDKPYVPPQFSKSSIGGSKILTKVHPEPTDTNDLVFESRFECGNLAKVVKITSTYYELYLRPDMYTKRHKQWYYFRVSNTKAIQTYR